MRGTVYYYYDRILVTNCKLRTLVPYAGMVPKGSAVQLIVYPLETDHIPLSAPTGISADGDFYLAALSKDIIYQVHKSGTLIRVYANSVDQVEETVMGAPMSILAMIRKCFLLKGSIISIGKEAYVLLGGAEQSSACEEVRQNCVLLVEEEEGYKGISCSYPGEKAGVSQESPSFTRLRGIVKVQYTKGESGDISVKWSKDHKEALSAEFALMQGSAASEASESLMMPIEDVQEKKDLLLENIVGFPLLSQSLKEQMGHSTYVEKAVKRLAMSVIAVRE